MSTFFTKMRQIFTAPQRVARQVANAAMSAAAGLTNRIAGTMINRIVGRPAAAIEPRADEPRPARERIETYERETREDRDFVERARRRRAQYRPDVGVEPPRRRLQSRMGSWREFYLRLARTWNGYEEPENFPWRYEDIMKELTRDHVREKVLEEEKEFGELLIANEADLQDFVRQRYLEFVHKVAPELDRMITKGRELKSSLDNLEAKGEPYKLRAQIQWGVREADRTQYFRRLTLPAYYDVQTGLIQVANPNEHLASSSWFDVGNILDYGANQPFGKYPVPRALRSFEEDENRISGAWIERRIVHLAFVVTSDVDAPLLRVAMFRAAPATETQVAKPTLARGEVQVAERRPQNFWLKTVSFSPDAPDAGKVGRRARKGSLLSKISPADREINKNNAGMCAINYLLSELPKSGRFKKLAGHGGRKLLIDELGTENPNGEQMLEYCMKHGVTVYILDMFGNLLAKANVGKGDPVLVFMINDEHCYSITDDVLRQGVFKRGRLQLDDLVFKVPIMPGNHHVATMDDILTNGLGTARIILVSDVESVEAIAAKVIETCGAQIHALSVNRKCELTEFEHPVTGQIIKAAWRYHERKQVFDKLRKITDAMDFEFWHNQTYTKLAIDSLKYIVGAIPQSKYGPDLLEIIANHSLRSYIDVADLSMPDTGESRDPRDLDGLVAEIAGRANQLAKDPQAQSVDYYRCYSSILVNMKDPWPVFAVTDTITDCTDSDLADMKAGLYWVDRGFRMGRPEHIDEEYELEEWRRRRIAKRRGKDIPVGRGVVPGGYMSFKAGWYPPSVIRRCIEHRYIERGWVTRKIVSQQSVSSRTFRKYVQKIYDEVGPGEAKYLINNLVGYLGKAYQRTYKGAVTTCALTAGATESQYTDRNVKVHITELNGVYFMKYETKTQLTEGHAALQMYIIGQSYVLLDDLVRKTCGPDTVPVAFNTDAFKAINMRPLDFPETPTFGDIRKEAKVTVRVSRRRVAEVLRVCHPPEEDPDWYKKTRGAEDLLVRGGVVIGPAGSGKTTKLVELYNECKTAGKRVAVLTPTHGAKKNLCARGVTDAMTIDKYYGKVKDANVRINPLKACDEDVLLIDEFSMITYDWYHVFMQAKLAKPALVFVFFGDDNQCDAVTKYKCRIVETSVMQFVGGYNLVRLPYIAATGRYTEETKVELDKLLNNGTWEHYQPHWPAVGTDKSDVVDIPFNIVFTNRLRRKLNQQACEAYCSALPRKDIVEIAGRKFAVGMPLVCFDNITALGFNNNDMFTITGFSKTDGDEVEAVLVRRGRKGKKEHKIERSWFSKKKGENYVFEHYWASTVNRVQGITLHGKYNVHEIDIMPLNHLYTALSRTVDYKLVAVGKQRKTDFVWREKPRSPQEMISPKKADQQGVIYRIDDGNQWYVGKTVVRDGETYETAVVRRFKEHHDKPTCDKMREWLKSAQDATIGVVKSGYYMSDYQLDRFETLVLTHESVVRTEGCMNTQKVVGIAPEIKIAKLGNESKQIAECMQAATGGEPTVTFDKLVIDGAIKIDPKKKRYRVSYIEGGKTKRKEFYYRDDTETGVQNVAVDFYKTMMKMSGGPALARDEVQ